jgi:hypothetical protein
MQITMRETCQNIQYMLPVLVSSTTSLCSIGTTLALISKSKSKCSPTSTYPDAFAMKCLNMYYDLILLASRREVTAAEIQAALQQAMCARLDLTVESAQRVGECNTATLGHMAETLDDDAFGRVIQLMQTEADRVEDYAHVQLKDVHGMLAGVKDEMAGLEGIGPHDLEGTETGILKVRSNLLSHDLARSR